MASLGFMAGLGKGISGFADILGEKSKQDWLAQQEAIKHERALSLETLRASREDARWNDQKGFYQQQQRDTQAFTIAQSKEQNALKLSQYEIEKKDQLARDKANQEASRTLAIDQRNWARDNAKYAALLPGNPEVIAAQDKATQAKLDQDLLRLEQVTQKTQGLQSDQRTQMADKFIASLGPGVTEQQKTYYKTIIENQEVLPLLKSLRSEGSKVTPAAVADVWNTAGKEWNGFDENRQKLEALKMAETHGVDPSKIKDPGGLYQATKTLEFSSIFDQMVDKAGNGFSQVPGVERSTGISTGETKVTPKTTSAKTSPTEPEGPGLLQSIKSFGQRNTYMDDYRPQGVATHIFREAWTKAKKDYPAYSDEQIGQIVQQQFYKK